MSPNEVRFNLTLNLDQINLILEGLGCLPFNRVEQLAVGIRAYTLKTLKQAEEQALAEAAAAEAVEPQEAPQ